MVWCAVRWLIHGKSVPDPWDAATAARLDDPEIKPLCTRCLCPHEETDWFCPNCGMAASPTTNWMPYLNYLSLGDVFRHGTSGDIPLHWTAVLGYILVSSIYYGGFVVPFIWLSPLLGSLAAIPGLVFLAFYWRQLAGNIRRHRDEQDHRPTPIEAGTGIAPAG